MNRRADVARAGGTVPAVSILRRLLARLRPARLRVVALRLRGYRGIHPGVVLASMPTLQGTKALTIGEGSFINVEALIDVTAPVTIGRRVAIGQRLTIVTETHEQGIARGRAARRYAEPVVIGDGCWIGANVVILPGVEVGPGSIVAAGAVVVAHVPPNTLAGGVPARPIRDLD